MQRRFQHHVMPSEHQGSAGRKIPIKGHIIHQMIGSLMAVTNDPKLEKFHATAKKHLANLRGFGVGRYEGTTKVDKPTLEGANHFLNEIGCWRPTKIVPSIKSV